MKIPFKKFSHKNTPTAQKRAKIAGIAYFDFLLLKSINPVASHIGKQNEKSLGIESKAPATNKIYKT